MPVMSKGLTVARGPNIPFRLSMRFRWLQSALAVLFLLTLVFLMRTYNERRLTTPPTLNRSTPSTNVYTTKSSEPTEYSDTLLPQIPPKLWQVSILPDSSDAHRPIEPPPYATQWLSLHPSFAYSIIDASGALLAVNRLEKVIPPLYLDPSHLGARSTTLRRRRDRRDTLTHGGFPLQPVHLYNAIAQPVMQADLVRYALLALEGGVYSDSDTYPVRPLREWVPVEYRNQTRLIVGVEADAQPPVPGTIYPVQLGQWTIAGAKGHPVFWRMFRRVFSEVERRIRGNETDSSEGHQAKAQFSVSDILTTSGPVAWTEEIYAHLSDVTGAEFSWKNLTRLRKPVLHGDVLVLPIDAFATGVPHSGASLNTAPGTMVRHDFSGSWKHQP
ncbi:Initiation-specific alpha-1,6-mannosyltransferase [Colletotrichum spinosum]|uniref:Initiation-specific alpha-1,6-mannosyltransferase n=1 Tax=Colletotrichum spinosum TaxID=1347390 RepID=A0A4V6QEF5_9PEZI|nr:Initiation-specific alpha-1,6-mannosyltransferase [Colletotrichum spinosum]